jgi:RNA polymerase sigma-70 factor (ECF subfamily)
MGDDKTRAASDGERDLAERKVRSLLAKENLSGATAAALELYGAEVFGFVEGVLDDRGGANEVYSAFTERLWRGLSGFHWDCSLRTWSYVIARNELARYRSVQARRTAIQRPISRVPSVAAPEPSTRHPFQRTTFTEAVARLRGELPDGDRDLLVLRVDRGLSWRDVALSFVGLDAPALTIERESVRLRQRFQLIKRQLKKVATAQGLLGLGGRHENVETEVRGRVLRLRRREPP